MLLDMALQGAKFVWHNVQNSKICFVQTPLPYTYAEQRVYRISLQLAAVPRQVSPDTVEA